MPRRYCATALSLLALLILSLPAFARSGILEWGGSNYVAFDVVPQVMQQGDWKDSSVFRTPTCQFRQAPRQIERDLADMHRNGQRKLALMLWHVSQATDRACGGYLLNSRGGRFQEPVIANLKLLLRSAAAIGFDEVQIRFAPLGNNTPRSWKAWSQAHFDENWSVIASTLHAIGLHGSPKIVVDLGAELGGADPANCPYCGPYVQRIWANYVRQFNPASSYGFSIPYGPGRLARLIEWLSAGGAVPSEFAVDLYLENQAAAIVQLGKEARSKGIGVPRILIQETFFSDPQAYRQLVAGAQQGGVEIRAVMQWPKQRGAPRRSFPSSLAAYIYRPTPP